jgi:hypothetical protein
MIEGLDPEHLAIINRATKTIPRQDREAFRKMVFDLIRPMVEPTHTMIRHAVGQAHLKFGRRI